MKSLRKFFYILSFIVLNPAFIAPALAQQNNNNLDLTNGRILTGFSVSWTGASRDRYNHEFERSFREFGAGIDAFYFITDRIGIGPELEYQYLYLDLENPPDWEEPASNDQWTWNFKYGAKAGWFAPVKEIFGTAALGNSTVFAAGGVNWLRNQRKFEGREKSDPQNFFGYSLSTGLIVPLDKKIGLEWKLQWEARRMEYYYGEIVDGNPIVTGKLTGWPSTLSLGVGLKVAF